MTVGSNTPGAEESSTDETTDPRADLPGSQGEHELQAELGTADRAEAFYDTAMQHALTSQMKWFLMDRWMGFASALDGDRPVTEPCFADEGFIRILADDRIAWPAAAMVDGSGPLVGPNEERFLSLVTVDWWDTTVGLHINGSAHRRVAPPVGVSRDGPATDWYVLDIEEAYIHCAKHIPELAVDDGAPEGPEVAPSRTTYDRLVPAVEKFIGTQVVSFLGTADSEGETDLSPRIGPPGFVQVLDEHTLAWPEYRGNGIHASMGNIRERGVATLTFLDWWNTEAIVRVSGSATLHDEVAGATDLTDVDRTKKWVLMDVEEATVTTDPPLPSLSVESFDPPWGTDDEEVKKSGFFTEA
ncbi:pyridoxamine 5'-phosphate oxidase family protein [Halomicroarcula sp. F28]|uniref:pyridoxamine 5'-phosphate oxidase family protein n=1 Tax=Haloarcula salinisoli TaxID=2487746 RepID=UPI001C73CDB5|nr:pyridoxamine 5'-phosphate oxidase family protein [Halomicroarcula salinisoli]MBX0286188.1 pyridoxamine 5'-phosphate oxidase family protein [Halomicroarcula salinisoli]